MTAPFRIAEPGVYDLTHDQYHADCCPEPSLSAGLAHTIVSKSARHAWLKHPRLNPTFERKHRDIFDLGDAAHTLMLRDERAFAIVHADDWRTNAAKQQRGQAYLDGKIPLLAKNWPKVQEMVAAGRAQLIHHHDARHAFENGKPEQAIVWREGEIWCRARLDWLPSSGNVFCDYKSTGADLPEWGRRSMYDLGNDLRAAFYLRGIRAVLGLKEAHYLFVVQETAEPYGLMVYGLTPEALELGNKKAEEAIRWWTWCRRNGKYPCYPKLTAYADVPPWEATAWEMREARTKYFAESQDEEFRLGIDFQKPLGIEDELARGPAPVGLLGIGDA